jgi:hypothetical protein
VRQVSDELIVGRLDVDGQSFAPIGLHKTDAASNWLLIKLHCIAQSRQSAKRFSSRWNWDSPTPLAAGECAPPPFGPGGRAHSLAAKGVGESQFQRGDIHCGALCI